MRKAFRVAVVVLLAFLLQSTLLPLFKINGIIIDLMSIVLFSTGYAFGLYSGLTAGVFSALIMESISGDLPGLTAVICVGAGGAGAWVGTKVKEVELPGQRRLERRIKRYAPMVLICVFVMLKEFLYIVYFYLNGMEMSLYHLGQMIQSGVYTGAAALAVHPLLQWYLARKPGETLVARVKARRREKTSPKKIGEKEKVMGLPFEGGTDA